MSWSSNRGQHLEYSSVLFNLEVRERAAYLDVKEERNVQIRLTFMIRQTIVDRNYRDSMTRQLH